MPAGILETNLDVTRPTGGPDRAAAQTRTGVAGRPRPAAHEPLLLAGGPAVWILCRSPPLRPASPSQTRQPR